MTPNSIVNLRDGRILKAVVSFYQINSETAFERHRGRNRINDVNTILALKKHFISFLGPKDLSSKHGRGDFDVELYHMALKSGSLKSVSSEEILQSIQNSVKTIQIYERCLKQMNATNHTVI